VSRRRDDLDSRFRWISIAIVMLFSSAFALGLILYVLEPGGGLAATAIHTGLLLLIASPAARMAIATADRLRERDWTFLAMTLVVAIELMIVLWRASVGD
jgi:uncharacterized membrane protein